MSIFSDISIRVNSDTEYVEASWWNDIRTALINAFGGGATAESKFTMTDNQSTFADITSFTFDGASYGSVVAEYTIYRYDGTSTERRETGGVLKFGYKPQAGSWSLDERRSAGDDALNITGGGLQVTTTSGVGQVQYKTDNMGGSDHYFTWKIISTTNIEV